MQAQLITLYFTALTMQFVASTFVETHDPTIGELITDYGRHYRVVTFIEDVMTDPKMWIIFTKSHPLLLAI